jgi:lipopolysaccharide assembly outer membrane protein LptD (OstA)
MEGLSMKRVQLLFLLACLVTPAVGQNSRNFETGGVSFEARSQQREGTLLRCRGDVEMSGRSFVLRADEVDYHSDTGVAEARGNVRIQLLPVTPSAVNSR